MNAESAEGAERNNYVPREDHRPFRPADVARQLHVTARMKERLNRLTETIIGAALDVHREIGPGMLESAYEACLVFELLRRELQIERQKPLPLVYRGHRLQLGYRLDILVEDLVIVEVKAIERLERVHGAQLLSYLRLTGCKVGLVINFNVRWLVKGGIHRVVNGFPD